MRTWFGLHRDCKVTWLVHRQGRVLFEVSLHWVHGFETSFMHGLGHVLAHLPVLSCPQLQRLALSGTTIGLP